MEDELAISECSPIATRSDSKAKRAMAGLVERSELYHKTVKVRGLEHYAELNRKGNCKETECSSQPNREGLLKIHGREASISPVNMGGCGLGLNAEDVSSSVNVDPYYHQQQNSIGQTAKPRDNNGQKRKNERMKRKIELAKKEQADRFAKIAAPTGLLTGLNPGIINHVRNTKQVHSIIEALVKSEKYDSNLILEGKQGKSGGERKELKDIEKGTMNALSTGMHIIGYSAPSNECELEGDNGNSCMIGKRTKYLSDCNGANSVVSNDDASTNVADVTALSINAARVASQWLELLNQDTEGRLAALRSSRKRVWEVIHTEFPCLITKEFSYNNNSNPLQDPGGCEKAAAHHARWSALFFQLDASLCEEECQLVSWQKQVQEMQLQCEHGLIKYTNNNMVPRGSPRLAALQNDIRLDKDPGRDLAVRAAAASIYSTCNFLSSMENQSLV
ncbi:unnamed protein product [Cuscuta epithymum]|uniref:Uncharacterized protein n=1 Tax=Cuscuta epithymum TaxID=186058 RepID=A0AAV0C1X7_9ASTE|nr:unnamed protein product [Cuscuta epithymum]